MSNPNYEAKRQFGASERITASVAALAVVASGILGATAARNQLRNDLEMASLSNMTGIPVEASTQSTIPPVLETRRDAIQRDQYPEMTDDKPYISLETGGNN